MTHQQALRHAHKLGITNISHTASKIQIIRAIQEFTGHHHCFACDESQSCKKVECAWRADCLSQLTIRRNR